MGSDIVRANLDDVEGLKKAFACAYRWAGSISYFPSNLRSLLMEAGFVALIDGVPQVVEPYSHVFKTRKHGLIRRVPVDAPMIMRISAIR